MRRLFSFRGGIHPATHKLPEQQRPWRKLDWPEQLVLPLHQHIGAPAKPLVKVGEQVFKGQKLGEAQGYVSVPVHAPTSAVVQAIETRLIPHPSGLSALCVVLKPDGKDHWGEHLPVDDFRSLDPSVLRNRIRDAGIVGLGGAGFPSFIKMNPGPKQGIDTVVLNGVECEPWISCDAALMLNQPEVVLSGAAIIRHAVAADNIVIAVEDNKPQAIAALRRAAADMAEVEIVAMPTRYPAGSEKQLIYNLIGREVPIGGLASHIGVVGQNVATASAIHHALHDGEPLLSRLMTVAGTAVPEPCNVEVPFGMSMGEVLRQCGADTAAVQQLIMGGPMMGFAMHDLAVPVIKTSNCILAHAEADPDSSRPEEGHMPCIRCGACAEACPVSLLPQQLYWNARYDRLDATRELSLFDCIECGCCSYVCPSEIPLVQYFRYAKGAIWRKEKEREKADKARQRNEVRDVRLEREKQEKARKRAAKKAAMQKKLAQKQAEHARAEAEQRRDAAMQRVTNKDGDAEEQGDV